MSRADVMSDEIRELAGFVEQLARIIDKQEDRIRALEIIVANTIEEKS